VHLSKRVSGSLSLSSSIKSRENFCSTLRTPLSMVSTVVALSIVSRSRLSGVVLTGFPGGILECEVDVQQARVPAV
jgi:hypothetical protein